jgi:hypothetical protein
MFKNFDELVVALRDYIRDNPNAEIVENDDPIRLTVRYEDATNPEHNWAISANDLYLWLKTQPQNKADLIRRSFKTSEGKQALLDVILHRNGSNNEQNQSG